MFLNETTHGEKHGDAITLFRKSCLKRFSREIYLQHQHFKGICRTTVGDDKNILRRKLSKLGVYVFLQKLKICLEMLNC